MSSHIKNGLRLAGLAAVFGICAVAWHAGAVQALSWSSLVAHRLEWADYVAKYPISSPFVFVAIYAFAVALSLPVGLWFSLLSGLLFGMWLGGILAVFGAGIGAILLFLLARGLLSPFFEVRFSKPIGKLRPGLEQDGFSYLLALRLMPVFPFWLVNLAPALIGMRLAPYAAATMLGMIPTSFVLAAIGAGLGETLAAGATPNAAMLLRPIILLPLLALAVLAVLPALWRKWQKRTRPQASTTI